MGGNWQTFSFKAAPSSLEPTPFWLFDDGEMSQLQSPGHLFMTPGKHVITLGLIDERGGLSTATASTLVAVTAGSCPDEMANMGRSCIDRFEASRPDATAYEPGVEFGAARSVQGVLPWQPQSPVEAVSACAMAGKRLCGHEEWLAACTGSLGPSGFLYPYGNAYKERVCNDFNAYRHGAIPTGAMPGCVSRVGAFDMLGNAWELVLDADSAPSIMVGGGYYSQQADCQTQYPAPQVPNSWYATDYGFRCCKDAQ